MCAVLQESRVKFDTVFFSLFKLWPCASFDGALSLVLFTLESFSDTEALAVNTKECEKGR